MRNKINDGWAKNYIEKLMEGETVSFRPRGNSMSGRVDSGQMVTVSPDVSEIKKGDVVLCIVAGKHYLHLVSSVVGGRYQISNNKGRINGHIGIARIYGVMV